MMKWLTLILTLLLPAAVTSQPPQQKLQRRPLQKSRLVLKSPASYEKRILHYDEKTGQAIYYDPKLRVVPLDVKSGKYGLRWIGYDGKEKTIVYQRPDVIDAVVSASASRTASGQYLYVYNIKNLLSSGQHLSTFALQTFAADAKPLAIGDGYVGQFSHNREMKDGNWIGFGSTNFDSAVGPGRSTELKILSFAPPGLVECRITGGRLGMKGVGEEMPQELENVLLGYEAWPKGYTIGPNANLNSLPAAERVQDVLAWLPKFQRLGWILPAARRWYEQNLHINNFEQVYKRAEQDLKTGRITSEVYDVILAIRQ